LFVEVETDEGVTGLGECTDYLSNPHLVRGLEAIKPLVVGADPSHIEEIWQRLFHAYSDLNGRGYVSHLISAIDIALWDIKGKVLGVPIYDLLGGPVRDSVPLYTHVPDQAAGAKIDDMVAAARKTKAGGYQAIKTDPFKWQWDRNSYHRGAQLVERLSPQAVAEAVDWMEALRDAVGPNYELLVDAHARFDVASAIAGANALEHIDLIWFEEPVHVESNDALKQVRENARVPLCIGERHFTRWDYTQILRERLVDYIMPDVAWCGGISELRRIAALAEPHYIRVSPHDALGPISIAAGFQVCMSMPNLYRQECVHTWFDTFAQLITPMFEIRNGAIYPNSRPGLGIELVREEVERHLVDADDPRALPYWWRTRGGVEPVSGRRAGARASGRR
ncbi:MAG: mandelate racemase/muconate lactonizing enzyme family protein, partial [Chloroflexi bacterium]|nr:mandelate racemase/muconate lactonizing enzyme family protein [Chloroflexota bacterium]